VVDDETRETRKKMETKSVDRVRQIIYEKLHEKTPYGLGQERTVKEWEIYTGIDLHQLMALQRTYLGLVENYTRQDILMRYGSTNVSSILKQLKQLFDPPH
jgi:hypothetical protein